jgi:LL-diaminopimelate aminotransferase
MPARSKRLDALPPYIFAVIGDRLREMKASGIDVVRLDIGSPDLPPPDAVVAALSRSASDPDAHGYTGYRGTASFRRAVATYYERRFGVLVDPDTQVLPLMGSKEGIINIGLAYLSAGDVVLIPDIGYPSYAQGARLADADIHWMPVREADGFLPDVDEIPADIRDRAKIMWVNYPNNPTGAIADSAFYERVVAFCKKHDILLVSDNPYCDVTFDGYVAGSILQVKGAPEHTVEFMSLSKSHNMAGWRLGAAVGAPIAIKTLLQVKSNFDSGHFQAVYDAGCEALLNTPDEWVEERNCIYAKRRDRVMECLPYIGLEAQNPKGSLYLWGRVHDGSAMQYVEDALTQAHVSMAPGGAYGPGGDDYVRISIGVADDRLEEALDRLMAWYKNR